MTEPIRFVVSVDTEEDNWLPTRNDLGATNVRELPRLARLFTRLGVRPTYFTTWTVVDKAWAADVLREVTAGGAAEIGAHLHPWNTPPLDEALPLHGSMLSNYPLEAQVGKIRQLAQRIEEVFGRYPTTFRAGRFALGSETVRALQTCGFRVDSSVTPFYSWRRYENGPDFTDAPLSIYRLDGRGDVCTPAPNGGIIEVPLSAGYTRMSPSRWPALVRQEGLPLSRRLHLPGIASRLHLLQRVILSPETCEHRHMVGLSRRLIDGGVSHLHLFFHSTSLRPGLSPFTRTRRDVEKLYDKIERFIETISRRVPLAFVTVEEAADGSKAATPAEAAPAPLVIANPARTRPPRALVINYHFPPDASVGGLRWAGLTKYLARAGWEVHVLTASNDGESLTGDGVQVHGCRRFRTINDLYRRVALRFKRKVPVYHEPVEYHGLLSAIRKEVASLMSFPDESRGWTLRAGMCTRRLIRRFRPDVIVTSGPPHAAHLAGTLGAWGTSVPLVVDLRDPWSNQSRAWRNHPVYGRRIARALIKRLERLVFRRARAVIANTTALADALRERYPAARILWIPNGVDPERLPQLSSPRDDGLSVVYAGTLYGGRDLGCVLEALQRLSARRPDVAAAMRLRVAGHATDRHKELLQRQIRETGLAERVEMLGVLPGNKALCLVARARVAIVLAQEQELQVPGKLYEALGLGVWPLVLAEPTSAAAVEAGRLGCPTADPADVDAIAEALESLASHDRRPTCEGDPPVAYEGLAAIVEGELRRVAGHAPAGEAQV